MWFERQTNTDALWSLSNVNDQSGWAIGWGESARDNVFYIPAILVAGVCGNANKPAYEHDVRGGTKKL
jgi:hypothetical protein